MDTTKHFLAVDLGATSGRTVVGTVTGGHVSIREFTRFANPIVRTGGHLFWDIYHLYGEIVAALARAADEHLALTSIGIDTWGCDCVMIGRDGLPLRCPYCYRDPQTEGAMERLFRHVAREEVYERTGIQFMPFNTLFQLYVLKERADSARMLADKILFVPDALSYMLTGRAVTERTVLSTSQLLNPHTRAIDPVLLRPLGLDETHFAPLVEPGELVGPLAADVQAQTGLGAVPVVAVAGHDTASAVVAVPAADEQFAYLSCGTWSLLGTETRQPVTTAEAYAYNFTNEGGIEQTTRLLKNICGLWLLERCRAEWKSRADVPQDVSELCAKAMAESTPFAAFINPDDPAFANPDNMSEAIAGRCRSTGQAAPETWQQTVRLIFESLALRYRQVLQWLCELAPTPIRTLHVIGGGSLNSHLMQMTASATRMPVVAGPAECTALGNIMVQAKAAGLVRDRFDMRRIVSDSVRCVTYSPIDTEAWDRAYAQFLDCQR